MTIYETRYKATKAKKDVNDVVVKVDAGGGQVGYMIMTASEYQVWRNQR